MGIAAFLEEPACPLCGAFEARVVRTGRETWIPEGPCRPVVFSVARCRRCSVCYTTPRLREADKHLAYEGGYPFYDRAREGTAVSPGAGDAAFARRAALLRTVAPRPGRLLDLGMGDGLFLALMRTRGWTVAGVDMEPSVVGYARSSLGLADCAVGDVERDALPAGPFDAVTIWGGLQLMYRPQRVLEKIREVLAPGGVLAIGVSNFGGLGARLFRGRWHGLGLPRHLVHFDAVTLPRLVQACAYAVTWMVFESPPWILAESLRHTCPLPGVLGRAARYGLRRVMALPGPSRLGETMILVAQPRKA